MKKQVASIICLMGILILVFDFPAQAKSIGYDRECRSTYKYQKVKQYQFSSQGKLYKLIQSVERKSKNPRLVLTSLCIAEDSSVRKIFDITGRLYLQYPLKKVSSRIFTFILYGEASDGDSGAIFYYTIDMNDPQNPKVTKRVSAT
jgi:hypothetical protein